MKLSARLVRYIVYASLIISIFFVSLSLYSKKNYGRRTTIEFSEIGTENLITEIRYIPENPVQGELKWYVDEVLLGPSVQRAKPMFLRSTKARSCFLRNGVLYLNLDVDAILQESGYESFADALVLLEKNIRKNFSEVEKIEFYVEGNEVSHN